MSERLTAEEVKQLTSKEMEPHWIGVGLATPGVYPDSPTREALERIYDEAIKLQGKCNALLADRTALEERVRVLEEALVAADLALYHCFTDDDTWPKVREGWEVVESILGDKGMRAMRDKKGAGA